MSLHRLRPVLVVVLLSVLSGLVPVAAAEPWEEAKARYAWTWFGLDEAQASAAARQRSGTLVVERRDGQPQTVTPPPAGPVITVHLHGGRVLWAHAVVGTTTQTEGVADAALLPWLGLPEAEVLKQAKAAGRAARVVARDGEHFPVTLDFNAERLNLHVLKGVVVAITTG